MEGLDEKRKADLLARVKALLEDFGPDEIAEAVAVVCEDELREDQDDDDQE